MNTKIENKILWNKINGMHNHIIDLINTAQYYRKQVKDLHCTSYKNWDQDFNKIKDLYVLEVDDTSDDEIHSGSIQS